MSSSHVIASASDAVVPLDHLATDFVSLRGLIVARGTLNTAIADLETLVKQELGVAETGTIAGQPVVTYKRSLRVAISQRLLKANFPAIVPLVQDISEVRTFRVLTP